MRCFGGTISRIPERPPGAGRRIRRALAVGAVWLAASCAASLERPGVAVVGIRAVSLGVTGGTAEVELEVTNPNDRTLRVVGLRYRLEVEDPEADAGAWSVLARGVRSEAVTLEARDTTLVSVEVPFEYRVVGATVRSLLGGREVRYRFDGEVRIEGPVGEIRIPLQTTGVL